MNSKTKIFGLFAFSLLALVLVSALGSAASLTIDNVNYPATVSHDDGSFDISFDITNAGVADPAIGFVLSMTSGDATLTMSNVPIADGPVTISVTGTINFPKYQSGNLVGKVIVDDQGSGGPKEVPFSISINAEPALEISQTQEITSTQNGKIEVKNKGNIDWSDVDLTSAGDFDVDFSSNNFNLAAGETKIVTVTPTNLGDVGFGSKSITITATANDGTTANLVMSLAGSFCKAGEVGGNLEITDVRIDNKGEGKDDEWKLLDIIEVEVTVDNNGDDDVNDVFVEFGLFDSAGKNYVGDLEFENADEEEYDIGRIRDGSDETITFSFKVPADFEDGSYRLVVKAYSDDLGEDEECTALSNDHDVEDKYTNIDIQREDDEGRFIAFDNIEFTPAEGTCGERILMTFDAYNVGDEDQDRVKITLKSSEFGIDEFYEITSDLDIGDKETISFEFTVPQDATDKFYSLRLSAQYDYKNGNYKLVLDDDVTVSFRVIGCGVTPISGDRIAIISAVLDSDEAVAGEELVVRATITNVKSESAIFSVDGFGYQSWASLDDVSPRSIEIASGESKDVMFTFTIDEDAEGEESFDIEVRDSAGNLETREIAVNIAGTSTPSTRFNLGDNAFLWIIGIVNVILIILIIVVAVRVASK